MNFNKITIIGLGLIGGSLARNFKNLNICEKLIACDKDSNNIHLAKSQKVINEGYLEICPDVYDSDIIFICTPVIECIKIIEILQKMIKKDCIITDVCSTKLEIINSVMKLKDPPIFIGGHPMAGAEKSGFQESNSELFKNKAYLLTKCKTTSEEAFNKIVDIINTIEARPVTIEAEQHDNLLAEISHIPHIIAAGLVNLLRCSEENVDIYKQIVGGGFIDTTRIASSNAIMWEHIITSNSKNILDKIDTISELLNMLKEDIATGNRDNIRAFFENARCFRNNLI